MQCYACGQNQESVHTWGDPCNYCERIGWLDWSGMPERLWTDPYGVTLGRAG